ncbi:MAG: hypothetical protein U1E76_12840 [Planctomycetota bacterium]
MPAEEKPAPHALQFTESDFSLFAPARQRDEEFNPYRLKLKHKLRALGDTLRADLKQAGFATDIRTSLSHPYTYNGFRVDAMWVYLSRPRKERAALKTILGAELGEDLDPNYQHLVMYLEINEAQVEIGMRIHQLAWWDTQNLKYKCEDRARAAEMAALLNRLDAFVMTIHDWKKEYRSGALSWGDIATFMQYFTPGDHRWLLRRILKKTEPLATSPELAASASRAMIEMIPLYRWIAWAPDNNFLKLKS